MSTIDIKITSYKSMAKCISIIRKYNPISMAEIKSTIEKNENVLSCNYIDASGVKKIRCCYDELTKNGAVVEIYEQGDLADRKFLCNLIAFHEEIAKEVEEQVELEVTAEEESGDGDEFEL